MARTRSGTVIDQTQAGVDARPPAHPQRLRRRRPLHRVPETGHHYTYDFSSGAGAACPPGTSANAGLNTNHVRRVGAISSGTTETGSCYDAADGILATTGPA